MAARKRDAGRRFTRDAAVAKMIASDTAMKVTTDAVQVLGGSATPGPIRPALYAGNQGDSDFRGHESNSATRHRPAALE